MLKIILCDDNIQFLESLYELLEKQCREIFPQEDNFIIGPVFSDSERAIEYIKKHEVDILLLDIDMPNLSGFDVAKILCKDYEHIKIIFMSAYDNLVYSTFEFYPFAYLRKSHITSELPKVLSRIADKLQEPKRQITLITTDGPKVIDVKSIVFAESKRNYLEINLLQGKQYICRGTLTGFEKDILPSPFFRIHSAFLVNLEYVEQIQKSDCVLIENSVLPIAQRRASEFKKTYMDYLRKSLVT